VNTVRRIAILVGFATWLFSFSLLRDARARFDGVPPALMGVLGVAILMTIGTAITAAIRLPVWPWCAVASAVFVMGGVLGIHFVKLHRHAELLARIHQPQDGGASLPAVLRDIFHTGGAHVFFFLVAPAILLAVGAYGWLRGPRSIFLDSGWEDPHAL